MNDTQEYGVYAEWFANKDGEKLLIPDSTDDETFRGILRAYRNEGYSISREVSLRREDA